MLQSCHNFFVIADLGNKKIRKTSKFFVAKFILQAGKSAKISGPRNLHNRKTAEISGPLFLQEGKSAKLTDR
jgi:hypothetical protein